MKINQELIELQKRAGLNNRDLAWLTGVNETTVRLWRKGDSAVSKSAVSVIRHFINFKE